MEQRKFVCKFCSKKFPCGKSLGGHIRTHMNNHETSLDSDDDDEQHKLRIDDNGGQSSYGLRENPKKNKRFVDQREMMALKQQQQQELLCCRECGKGFVSSKALCGHMACHSEREKILMDSQSDTEASSSPIRRRSKRAMKHHHHHHRAGGMMNQSNSSGSSDASEIEPEQEEMAWSLMMLSRDSSFKKGHNLVVNSLAESSDNNSVILETKSSSGEQLKIFNMKDIGKKVDNNQMRSGEDNGDIVYDSDNSDSGYFENGPKTDVSVDGFLKNTSNNNGVMRSGFNSFTTKQDKNLNRFNEGGGSTRSGSGRSSTKYDLRKSKRGFSSYGRKRVKYEFTESVYDSGEQSLETDSCAETNRSMMIKIHNHNNNSSSKAAAMVKKASGNGGKKKSKGHECPICFRVFKSGQALGGHKRSHFIGNQEHRTLVIQQQQQQQHQVAHHHEMHTLIDLNLPAPIE